MVLSVKVFILYILNIKKRFFIVIVDGRLLKSRSYAENRLKLICLNIILRRLSASPPVQGVIKYV